MSKRAVKLTSLIALILAYGVTRLYGLLSFPIFVDEAIHIERAVKGIIPEVFDRGKLLPVPVLMPFMALPVDELLVARLIVVVCGLLTLLAIVWTAAQLFSFWTGWWSGLIYILLPFALFYNRLDLADDFELLFAAVALAYSVRIARNPGRRLDTVMLTIALIGGVLSKVTSAIYLFIPPLTIVALHLTGELRQGIPVDLRRALRSIFPALLVAGAITVALLMTGYGALELNGKGADGLGKIPANIAMTLEWYWVLLTPIGCLLLLLGAIRRDRRVLLLDAIFVMIPAAYIVGGSRIFSRYVLFSVVPASIIVGYLIARSMTGRQRADAARAGVIIGLLAIAFVPVDVTMLTRPLATPLPGYDQTQYIDNAPVGIREMTEYLRAMFDQQPGQKQVVILGGRPNMHIVWVALHTWPDIALDRVDVSEADALAARQDIWLIVDGTYYPDAAPPGKTKVWSYDASGPTRGLELWH